MTKKISLFVLALGLPALGCPAGDDGGGADTAGDDGVDDGSGPGTGTAGDDDGATGMMTADSTGADGADDGVMEGGSTPVGDACTANADCMSLVCELFTDVEDNKDARCAETPAGGNTRITGTIWDFVTGEPVGGAGIVVASALNAATNPTMVTAIVEATAGGDGRIDATSAMPISAQLGIVGLVSADGYYLTATGLAAPNEDGSYDPGNGIHDIWAVPTGDLTNWSEALAMDAEIDAGSLPLGDAGGVIGLVRDINTGTPVEGATVVSQNDASTAIVRYLADDGTFNADGTGPSGIFVILEPMLAETFEAQMGGSAISGAGTAGSTNNAAFTLILNTGG
jgi:hypothetical protein